ncbi:hypothetical protein ACFOY2_04945 [Nonomuraea purpurea]|uniref:Major facilitator superfamily (MFS) profile domain-containing protein n=1 Tax=Nonomuraea purpurea TaxID=1849276 RepID=A0ABV8FXX7_9ACTN
MIVAGIALLGIVLTALVALMVDAMGWKGALSTWSLALLMTALIVGGLLLIEAGMTS